MASVGFDTHAYIKKLMSAGVPENQAEIHAETFQQMIDGELATKRDIEELRSKTEQTIKVTEAILQRDITELKTEIHVVKGELLKWLIGLIAVQSGIIIAIFRVIVAG